MADPPAVVCHQTTRRGATRHRRRKPALTLLQSQQIPRTESQSTKRGRGLSRFRAFFFGFWICFGFRISCFGFHSLTPTTPSPCPPAPRFRTTGDQEDHAQTPLP